MTFTDFIQGSMVLKPSYDSDGGFSRGVVQSISGATVKIFWERTGLVGSYHKDSVSIDKMIQL